MVPVGLHRRFQLGYMGSPSWIAQASSSWITYIGGSSWINTKVVPVGLHRLVPFGLQKRFQLDYIGSSSWITKAVPVGWHRR